MKRWYVYDVPADDNWHELPFVAAISHNDRLVTEARVACDIARLAGCPPEEHWDAVHFGAWVDSVTKAAFLPSGDRQLVAYYVSFHKGDALIVSPVPLAWLPESTWRGVVRMSK